MLLLLFMLKFFNISPILILGFIEVFFFSLMTVINEISFLKLDTKTFERDTKRSFFSLSVIGPKDSDELRAKYSILVPELVGLVPSKCSPLYSEANYDVNHGQNGLC